MPETYLPFDYDGNGQRELVKQETQVYIDTTTFFGRSTFDLNAEKQRMIDKAYSDAIKRAEDAFICVILYGMFCEERYLLEAQAEAHETSFNELTPQGHIAEISGAYADWYMKKIVQSTFPLFTMSTGRCGGGPGYDPEYTWKTRL